MKLRVFLFMSLFVLAGCGSNIENTEEIPSARTPITSASQLKVDIESIPFLLDGLRDLGLDCGKFDQLEAWKKEKYEYALCTYKDMEVMVWRWYLEADAKEEITSGSFQPWCQPYVASNNWAIAVWNGQVVKEFASFLETEAREDKNSANAESCLL
jgi:hypothetical protein